MNADRIETIVGGGRRRSANQPAVRHLENERGTGPAELAANRAEAPEATVPQYSLARILGVWAAAAGPMGALAWVVAPWLGDRLGGPEPFAQALLLCLTAGVIWQSALVLILVKRELGTLRWARVRDALWLRAPRDPNSGRVGGRLWLVLVPCLLLFGAQEFIPGFSPAAGHDLPAFLASEGGQALFRGAWGWFALVAVQSVFVSVLGEELLFRGLLLPRMRGAFGRWDWVANGMLFATYHLHMPWVIPATLLDTFALAYPSRRFQSAWMGIVVHSAQSVVVIVVVLAAVLG